MNGCFSCSLNAPTSCGAVPRIFLSPYNAQINVNETLQMTATENEPSGGQVDVTNSLNWASSDSAVATVDNYGLVTGIAVGSTTITAEGTAGFGSALVTVVSPYQLEIEPADDSVTLGVVLQYTLTGFDLGIPGDMGDAPTVTWASSDVTIATIDDTGYARAVGLGTCEITATTPQGSASTSLTVVAP